MCSLSWKNVVVIIAVLTLQIAYSNGEKGHCSFEKFPVDQGNDCCFYEPDCDVTTTTVYETIYVWKSYTETIWKTRNFTRPIEECEVGPEEKVCAPFKKNICTSHILPGKKATVTYKRPNSCIHRCAPEYILFDPSMHKEEAGSFDLRTLGRASSYSPQSSHHHTQISGSRGDLEHQPFVGPLARISGSRGSKSIENTNLENLNSFDDSENDYAAGDDNCCLSFSLELTNEIKAKHIAREGSYSQGSSIINGFKSWISSNGKSAIWYIKEKVWCIGDIENLSTSLCSIHSTIDVSCPAEITDGQWKFFVNGEFQNVGSSSDLNLICQKERQNNVLRDAKAIGNQNFFSAGCCPKIIVQDSGYFPSILNLTFDGSTFNNRPKWCDTKPCDSDPKGCTYCLEFSSSEKWVIRWEDSENRKNKVIYSSTKNLLCPSEIRAQDWLFEYSWGRHIESIQCSEAPYFTPLSNIIRDKRSTKHFKGSDVGNVSIDLLDYCKKSRGQNSYDLDCHKFVDCWDSHVFLKSCHPPNLVFDPIESVCKYLSEPGMALRCRKKRAVNGRDHAIHLDLGIPVGACTPGQPGCTHTGENCTPGDTGCYTNCSPGQQGCLTACLPGEVGCIIGQACRAGQAGCTAICFPGQPGCNAQDHGGDIDAKPIPPGCFEVCQYDEYPDTQCDFPDKKCEEKWLHQCTVGPKITCKWVDHETCTFYEEEITRWKRIAVTKPVTKEIRECTPNYWCKVCEGEYNLQCYKNAEDFPIEVITK